MFPVLALFLLQQTPPPSATQLPASPVAKIVITPGTSVTMAAQDTLRLTASAVDANGKPVPEARVTFFGQGAYFEASVEPLADFDAIRVGDRQELVRHITEADVRAFVAMTGDDNPLHVDRAYAATTAFKDIVVHGMLGASFVSTVIGTKLPGPGALWVSQNFGCTMAKV